MNRDPRGAGEPSEDRWTRRQVIAALLGAATAACSSRPVTATPRPATPAPNRPPPELALPKRSDKALSGSAFVEKCSHLRAIERESAIVDELLAGNVAPFLRHLAFVPLGDDGASTGVWVTSDYLAIGDDDDFVRIPMIKLSADRVANAAGCMLPTKKLVDAIYGAATCKLTSPPHGGSPEMASTKLYAAHNREIEERRGAAGCKTGDLLAGPKKDLVMSERELGDPGHVVIYGWFMADGRAIQPLSLIHSDKYVDFSHGVRLVHDEMLVRGEPRSLREVLADPNLAGLVSDEGPFTPRER